MRAGKMVELKLSVERVQTAMGEREKEGVRFVRMISFVLNETITTDRLVVTEEAVRLLNSVSI